MRHQAVLLVIILSATTLAGCDLPFIGGAPAATEPPVTETEAATQPVTEQAAAPATQAPTLTATKAPVTPATQPSATSATQASGTPATQSPATSATQSPVTAGTQPAAMPTGAPRLTMTASASDLKVGDQVTITVKPTDLGNPKFTLQLVIAGQPAATPTVFSVAPDQTLGPTPGKAGSSFDLVSATGGQLQGTFVLKATAPGQVTASMTASGETVGANNAFIPGNASATSLTLTVRAAGTGQTPTVQPGAASNAGQGGQTTQPTAAAGTTYTVKAGDTLFLIGLAQGVDWTQIAAANGLKEPYLIKVGDKLTIPAKAATGGPTGGSTGGTGGAAGVGVTTGPTTTYVVKAGDTLFLIGLAQGVDWQKIAAANNLTAPYTIKVGEKLTIPGKKTYVVKPGDYLKKIADALGLDWRDIARMNGLVAPYFIHPGDTLVIP